MISLEVKIENYHMEMVLQDQWNVPVIYLINIKL